MGASGLRVKIREFLALFEHRVKPEKVTTVAIAYPRAIVTLQLRAMVSLWMILTSKSTLVFEVSESTITQNKKAYKKFR